MVTTEKFVPVVTDPTQRAVDLEEMSMANNHEGISIMQVAYYQMTGEVRPTTYIDGAATAHQKAQIHKGSWSHVTDEELRKELSSGYYTFDWQDAYFQAGVESVLDTRRHEQEATI